MAVAEFKQQFVSVDTLFTLSRVALFSCTPRRISSRSVAVRLFHSFTLSTRPESSHFWWYTNHSCIHSSAGTVTHHLACSTSKRGFMGWKGAIDDKKNLRHKASKLICCCQGQNWAEQCTEQWTSAENEKMRDFEAWQGQDAETYRGVRSVVEKGESARK